MTDQSSQNCGNCRFWNLVEEYDEVGDCRRRAPEIPKLPYDEYRNYGEFPWTFPGDWCGEWQPKPTETSLP